MLLTLILAATAVLVYYAWIRKPSPKPIDLRGLPVNFLATHRHRDIALDSATRRLWVKDERGRERVLDSGEIIGWEMKSIEVNRNGSCWNKKNYLEIKTNDLDRPVWRVRFKDHMEAFPSNRNHRECSEWFARLTAVYNHMT